MSVGLIGWGRFLIVDAQGKVVKVTVPAPSTDKGAQWLYVYLKSIAKEIGQSFDFVQFPPVSLAQGGDGAGCDGYGIFWRRQLDGTRYGSLEDLLACISSLNAEGTQSLLDLVLHQLIGENGGPGVFKYVGADGKTWNGAGQTTPGWFRGGTGNNDPIPPFRPEDDVAGGASTDDPFGREVSYQHAEPAGVTTADAIAFVKWLTQLTAAAGYRYDDVKGSWTPAVREIMDAVPDRSFYAEYFDANPATLNWWATSAPMNSRSAVEDFTLHFRLQAACNNFDATQFVVGDAGYWQWNPGLSAGFVDNPDTDTSDGQQVISNKGIAYALLLTLPMRMALVYGKDYFPASVWPGAYGLKPLIDNLCWINRMFAFGNCEIRYVDKDVLAITRDGNGGTLGWSGGLLTATNFNTLAERTITVDTPFGPNRWLHDYTGHAPDIWTDGSGRATLTIPSNAYSAGQSYVCYSPGGVNQPYSVKRRETTHTFIGDPTLRVNPVKNGTQVLPQRLYCAAGTMLQLHLIVDRTSVSELADVQIEVLSPKGVVYGSGATGSGTSAVIGEVVKTGGWQTIRLTGTQLPTVGAKFKLSATYTGGV